MLPGKKISPQDIVSMLGRRWWLLVLPPLVTTFAALVFASRVPNLYQSDMLIAIVPQRVPDTFVRSTVSLRTEERLDAITVQVLSRTVLEQLIAEFELYPEQRQLMPMEDVVQHMHDAIKVDLETPRRGPRGPEPTHAFHVKFTYPDPQVAAKVTQKLGSSFVDQNARDRGVLAEATSGFLDSQLIAARGRLEVQEKKLEEFRQQFGDELPTQLTSNLSGNQSAQMQVQAVVESLARDRDRKLMLERLYGDLVARPPSVPAPLPAGQTSQRETPTGTPRQQLAAARATLAQLETRLMAAHPDIQRAKRQVADLEAKVAAEPAESPAAAVPAAPATPDEARQRERVMEIRAEIESLDRQMKFKESEEARLRKVVAEYQRRVEAVPRVESDWISLTRDYDTLKETYETLLEKSEQARLAVDLERRQIGEQFRILDPANVPVKAVSPNRIQINAIGLAIGFVLGLAIAAILEIRDSSYRTQSDIVTVLALPVIALIPAVETKSDRKKRTRRQLLLGTSAVALAAGAGVIFWSLQLWKYVA